MDLLDIADSLTEALRPIQFGPPVAYVYNPLVYARECHAQYVKRYGTGTREILLLGMNPGPWGMAQTGIPFGEVGAVRDWLGIDAKVGKPSREHPKRPILGLACKRSEVSGARLWGWARQRFGTPDRFFKRFFIANYCPLCFMEISGKNLTPDKLPIAARKRVIEACDAALVQLVNVMKPSMIIGVGKFAADRAGEALNGRDIRIESILHPSPASPKANRDWAGQVEKQLSEMGVRIPSVVTASRH
ncbi:MAG: single-stranded DNA-binding protein [Planctomycetes bacterium]|nr:single-stranded DNA-binding protein [Planctomycetota bacterium]